MRTWTGSDALYWILRVSVAMCFVGHGMFGIITKEEWLPFFALVGIGVETAYRLMPLIGLLDIAVGLSVLFRPTRAVLLYMTVWAIWTGTLRPLTGGSPFELLERAGNYGMPLAFLVFVGRGSWFARADAPSTFPDSRRLWQALSWTTALLLVGHAGLALSAKPILVAHAGLLGFGAGGAMAGGVFELMLAALVLVTRHPIAFLGVFLWKVGTELLFPLSGAPVWEFVERGGSYGAPLALALLAAARPAGESTRLVPRLAGLRLPVLVLAASLLFPATGMTQQREDRTPIAPAGILDSLRVGGYTLVCRHTKTDHDQSDNGRERAQQRNLDAAGERDAKAIGGAVQALGLPFDEVLTNPMYRNYETGLYAFGRAEIDSALGGRNSSSHLRALLRRSARPGANRAIVTRVGIISGALEDHGVRRIEEGDCFVVRSTDSDFVVLARLRVQDWPR